MARPATPVRAASLQRGTLDELFEHDAASNNSVENIKTLMEQTLIPPQTGRYKVFIIDEVHMLSTAAFNAFLKTLEEPPQHVIFVLATTEKHKICPPSSPDADLRLRAHDRSPHHRPPEDGAQREGVTY
jgi:DNA polymerase III gamma/tau subunit